MENTIVYVIQVKNRRVYVIRVENTIVYVITVENTIVYVFTMENTIVYVIRVENTTVYVITMENTIVYVIKVENTIVYVITVGNTIVSVIRVGNIIVDVIRVKNTIVYVIRVENMEKSTPNYEYEHFVNAHLEAAAKYIPTKIKTKYRVLWETLAVREKRALVKTASKNYRKNPTNTNALKLKTAQYQLAGIYIKEQTEYIQNQIDRIRDSVEDRQSRIAWQTINKVSRRKNTAKAKLKAANQQERIKLWKQHFENLLGNPPKIMHEPITRIISKQLDIKLGPFTQEELDSVLRKIKNRKAAGLDEIPLEVWKTRQFDDILLRHCNAVYNENPIDRWMDEGMHTPLP